MAVRTGIVNLNIVSGVRSPKPAFDHITTETIAPINPKTNNNAPIKIPLFMVMLISFESELFTGINPVLAAYFFVRTKNRIS